MEKNPSAVEAALSALSSYAPILAVLLTLIGGTWFLATTLATNTDVAAINRVTLDRLEELTKEVRNSNTQLEALRGDVTTIKAALPLVVACTIDLQLLAPTAGAVVPESCRQAQQLTTPRVQ